MSQISRRVRRLQAKSAPDAVHVILSQLGEDETGAIVRTGVKPAPGDTVIFAPERRRQEELPERANRTNAASKP
jgi:hypothetical protein